MKMYAVVEVWFHTFTSALDGSEWPCSHLNHCIHGEGTLGTQWVRSCVSLRVSLDAMEKRKILLSQLGPEPWFLSHLAHSLLLCWQSYPISCSRSYIKNITDIVISADSYWHIITKKEMEYTMCMLQKKGYHVKWGQELINGMHCLCKTNFGHFLYNNFDYLFKLFALSFAKQKLCMYIQCHTQLRWPY
jgi:hypothetical protein